MRVLLSMYGVRGDVEPLVGLAVRLRALGAEVRVCAPPDWATGWPSSACRWCPSARRHPVRVRGVLSDLPAVAAPLAAAQGPPCTPEIRARAAAVADTIHTDGATVAATLLLDAVSRERPPAST